jgi:hypothetical protein
MHSLKPIDVLKMGLIEGDMAIVMNGVDHLARCVSTESPIVSASMVTLVIVKLCATSDCCQAMLTFFKL